VRWRGTPLAHLEPGPAATRPRVVPARELVAVPEAERTVLLKAIETWLAERLSPLAPLTALEAATRDPSAGSEARALLLALIGGHGVIARDKAGVEHLPRELRPFLRRLGVTFGALDVFAPALLKPAARRALSAAGIDRRPLAQEMPSVIASGRHLPAGYRPAGDQAVRVDVAEKLLRAAHEARAKAGRVRHFLLDGALATSTGLKPESWHRLLGAAGFKVHRARVLAPGAFGPPTPDKWAFRPTSPAAPARQPSRAPSGGAFAALAGLVR